MTLPWLVACGVFTELGTQLHITQHYCTTYMKYGHLLLLGLLKKHVHGSDGVKNNINLVTL